MQLCGQFFKAKVQRKRHAYEIAMGDKSIGEKLYESAIKIALQNKTPKPQWIIKPCIQPLSLSNLLLSNFLQLPPNMNNNDHKSYLIS